MSAVDGTGRPPTGEATVTRLRSIRTLTIARDLAFRQRALTVFAALGPTAFAVADVERADEVVALVTRQRADVVVVDVTASSPALLAAVTALCSGAPRVGVVIVADRAERTTFPWPVLPKWGWAAELTHAVQDAHRFGNPLKEDDSVVHSD